MILLDTNVVSEPWKPEPDPHVLAWLDAQVVETLYLSAITVAGLRYGVAALPAGQRRKLLGERLERAFLPVFAGRVLAFDLAAAGAYAELMAHARTSGLAIGRADGYIAAIAIAHGMLIASRDTSAYAAAGLDVINPWEAPFNP
ncbi:MAG TPA: type II toxin-antitoxin system VapC family toxin [Nevskiaceae bacterium]|nr:type II toxin-antitoxin system VapC family toxin [Nevskiaceae bacterium]